MEHGELMFEYNWFWVARRVLAGMGDRGIKDRRAIISIILSISKVGPTTRSTKLYQSVNLINLINLISERRNFDHADIGSSHHLSTFND